jgi:NADH-quinone oxidoreductase subunit J
MVLFLYVIMMLNLNAEVEPHKSAIQKIAATVAGGLLMIVLVGALRNAAVPAPTGTGGPQVGLIHNLGQSLYKDFMLPFEISSILFLAAMVGAVMLGKKEIK